MADTKTSDALCVRVLWGERTMATHLLHAGQSLNLANNGEPMSRADAPLRFEVSDKHFEVGFAEGVVGELYRNGETELSLGDVVHRGLAVEADGGWSCELGRADVMRLGRGPVWLEAYRVKAPPKAKGAVALDYNFLNTLLVCFALFAAVAMHAELTVPDEDFDDSVSSDITRMRHILVQAEKPQPKKVATAETQAPTKEPRKRDNPAEGHPRPPDKKVADTGGNNQLVAKDLVGRIFGGRGAAGIIGPGGLGKEIAGAMGNVIAANGDGNGGWSIKGDGAGGPGGDPARIGAIPTSGVKNKKGVGELCVGPGPCKESKTPDFIDSTQVVCGVNGDQCMDKELIRKVIASHRDQVRYCYELALQQSPSLAGKVSVGFMVSSSGTVPTANVVQSTVASNTIGDCLVTRVRSWQFPVAKAAGGYRVTYPFVFKPSGS
ncbi:MAG: AgmX/PglI C-terminal domain-containing protein [Myxococcaceae bacterium]